MFKSYFKDLTIFAIVNFVVFGGHVLLENNVFKEVKNYVVNLPTSYVLNISISVLICLSLVFLNKLFESQIGFVYLGLSVVKMFILYGVLNPTNELGEVFKKDALAFLVPFGLNLVLELLFTIKLLKINDLAITFKKH